MQLFIIILAVVILLIVLLQSFIIMPSNKPEEQKQFGESGSLPGLLPGCRKFNPLSMWKKP